MDCSLAWFPTFDYQIKLYRFAFRIIRSIVLWNSVIRATLKRKYFRKPHSNFSFSNNRGTMNYHIDSQLPNGLIMLPLFSYSISSVSSVKVSLLWMAIWVISILIVCRGFAVFQLKVKELPGEPGVPVPQLYMAQRVELVDVELF